MTDAHKVERWIDGFAASRLSPRNLQIARGTVHFPILDAAPSPTNSMASAPNY